MMLRTAGLVLLMLLSSWLHPVHVSVTNMDIDPESGGISLAVKLFSDDLQDLIHRKYGVLLNIVEQKDPGEKISAVNRYIAESFQCMVNGTTSVLLEFQESRMNEEAIWLYYHADTGGKIRRLLIRNRLMLEKFDDQTNLIILSYHDVQNGYRLNNKNTELSLNIKRNP
jgi:hypothetical protein